MTKAEAVKVIVRCRPLNPKEKSQGFKKIVQIDERQRQVVVRDSEKQFTFDSGAGRKKNFD